MNNVIHLDRYRNIKNSEIKNVSYQNLIQSMNKLDLLEEMVRFQEDRAKKKELALDMVIRGKTIFMAIVKSAETKELRCLAVTYLRFLDQEFSKFYQETV